MRTTLNIDDDVLSAAKAIAERESRSVGDVLSDLARRSLKPTVALATRNGIPQLPSRGKGVVITPDLVIALLDETL